MGRRKKIKYVSRSSESSEEIDYEELENDISSYEEISTDDFSAVEDENSFILMRLTELKSLTGLCKLLKEIKSELRLRFHKNGLDLMETDSEERITVAVRIKKENMLMYIFNVRETNYLNIVVDVSKFINIIGIDKNDISTFIVSFDKAGEPNKLATTVERVSSGGEVVDIKSSENDDKVKNYLKEYYDKKDITAKIPMTHLKRILKVIIKNNSQKIELALNEDRDFVISGKSAGYDESVYTYKNVRNMENMGNMDEVEDEEDNIHDGREQNIMSIDDSLDIIEDTTLYNITINANKSLIKGLEALNSVSQTKSILKVYAGENKPVIWVTPLSDIGTIHVIFHQNKPQDNLGYNN